MIKDIIAVLLIVCCMLYATGYILGGVYRSTQVVEVKKDFMRPCAVCPREYYSE